MSEPNWKQIGVIGVDAGICWIGDPCYILHKEGPAQQELESVLGKDWFEFCAKLGGKYTQFAYALGHPGLGMVVSTGYGDGVYPVYAKFNTEGRLVGVKVAFADEGEPERFDKLVDIQQPEFRNTRRSK
mgnify:CR=1 FL=1